jgi:hypothetical protein
MEGFRRPRRRHCSAGRVVLVAKGVDVVLKINKKHRAVLRHVAQRQLDQQLTTIETRHLEAPTRIHSAEMSTFYITWETMPLRLGVITVEVGMREGG